MNALNPTSVAEAGAVMAPFLGYDWAQNRAEVVQGINRYREHLYNRYHRRRLFDDVFHCFAAQDFPLECVGRTRCTNCYRGVTLPPDMAGVVSAWNYGAPLRVRSRWREAFTGRVPCSSEMSVVVLPQTFPTERVFRAATRLRFYAGPEDGGKTIHMEARMQTSDKTLAFALKADEWVQSNDPVYDILSISLPGNLKGQVTLATEDDYTLSIYAPWERVPAYTRVKFLQPCPGNVFIQGTRRFVPVWFDPDIVEVGSATVMEFYAQYVRLNKAKDPRDRETSITALQQANEELDGLIARHIARAIQDGPKRGPRPNRALPGYERTYKR
jgi:hypothetical protein